MDGKNNVADLMIECDACEATGIRNSSFGGQRQGEYIKCEACKGTGSRTVQVTKFIGRKARNDVTKVLVPKEGFIGASPEVLSYEEFLTRFPAPDVP